MLFVIFILILVGSVVWGLLTDWENMGSLLTTLLGSVCVIISLLVIVFSCGSPEAEVARLEARREMLVYQLEANVYDNDAGDELGKRELYVDIQAWNEDLALYKNLQDNFWLGIYVPNVYDQFEPISLKTPDK